MASPTISRLEARAKALRFYRTGKVCPQGHSAERYTSTGNCVSCAKISTKERGDVGYFRDRYKKDPSRFVAGSMDHYRANRDTIIQNVKAWAARNPERRHAIANSYKHRRRAVEAGGMSGPELTAWVRKQKKICYWCSAACERDFQVDHYVPLSKGGAHLASNLVVACGDCNRRKNASDPYQFAIRRGRLF